MACGYVFSNDRSGDWPDECRAGEPSSCDTAIHDVPKVDVGTSNNGNWCCTEAAAEKTGQHDSFHILGYREWDLEDGEDEEAEEEGACAAVYFRERTPDQRAYVHYQKSLLTER